VVTELRNFSLATNVA